MGGAGFCCIRFDSLAASLVKSFWLVALAEEVTLGNAASCDTCRCWGCGAPNNWPSAFFLSWKLMSPPADELLLVFWLTALMFKLELELDLLIAAAAAAAVFSGLLAWLFVVLMADEA